MRPLRLPFASRASLQVDFSQVEDDREAPVRELREAMARSDAFNESMQ